MTALPSQLRRDESDGQHPSLEHSDLSVLRNAGRFLFSSLLAASLERTFNIEAIAFTGFGARMLVSIVCDASVLNGSSTTVAMLVTAVEYLMAPSVPQHGVAANPWVHALGSGVRASVAGRL